MKAEYNANTKTLHFKNEDGGLPVYLIWFYNMVGRTVAIQIIDDRRDGSALLLGGALRTGLVPACAALPASLPGFTVGLACASLRLPGGAPLGLPGLYVPRLFVLGGAWSDPDPAGLVGASTALPGGAIDPLDPVGFPGPFALPGLPDLYLSACAGAPVGTLPATLRAPIGATTGIVVLAKIERVTSDEDGVRVKFTTSGIKTKGAYAKKYVEESLDEMKSGEYGVRFDFKWNSIPPAEHGGPAAAWSSIGVEVKVVGGRVWIKAMNKRLLTYDAKEKRIGSMASSKVMEELGNKLREEKNVNVRLAFQTKDGSELIAGVESLEKDDHSGVWITAKIKGGRKTLDYVQSANNGKAVLVAPQWLVICNDDDECIIFV